METANIENGFRIWGADKVVYGPVELPTLVNWVKEHRVTAATWVLCEKDESWHKATDVPELQMFFPPAKAAAPADPGAKAGEGVSDQTAYMISRPGSLRRVKVLADFNDEQLSRFVAFMEIMRVKQWSEIVKQGEAGDAMFMVLEGELRVRMMIAGKETLLVTLSPGEFFGEISLFDKGPRAADVVANQESVLLKIGTSAFQKLMAEAPDLAAPFLYAMGRTLTARIRADNKRYRDAINFARTAGR
jgi:CRP/FNR family transcriptional regulator, cyclic AMP receptor protein